MSQLQGRQQQLSGASQLRPRHRSTQAPTGGDPPEPPAQSYRKLRLGLLRLSTDSRQRFYRTFSLLGVLGGIAAVAVFAGQAANSDVLWASAGSVFLLACAGLVAYATKGLGIAAETADILRVKHAEMPEQMPVSNRETEEDQTEQSGWTEIFGGDVPRELTEDEEEWLSSQVLRCGSTDSRPPSTDEIAWIIENVRQAAPVRQESDREWVRRHIDIAEEDGPELGVNELSWLIQNIQPSGLDEGWEEESREGEDAGEEDKGRPDTEGDG